MKRMNVLLFALITAGLFLAAGCSQTRKIVKLEPAEVSDLVTGQSFIFVAERMNPMRGPNRTLTAYYDVKVKKDTLDSFLPYFGRAYGGIIDPSRGGLRFTSKDYRYSVTEGRRNSWDVSITPTDVMEVQSMNFNIFDNGTATLSVTSTNRDPISFYGYLQPIDK